MIDALPAGDREQPRPEFAPAIKLANCLESPHERVLCHLAGIDGVAARVGDEAVDPAFVAIDQLLKGGQRASLALPGQLLIGASLEVSSHSVFLELVVSFRAKNSAECPRRLLGPEISSLFFLSLLLGLAGGVSFH